MSTKISMLLPARGRPDHLARSVASVFDLATKPDEVEVIVRLDDDDPHLQAELSILNAWERTVTFTGSRLTYANIHGYYNGLAERADGDFLFLWNDDIEMRTQGWDRLLREAPLFSVQFARRDTTPTSDYTLPILGRSLFHVLGHISLNAYCDAWISDVSAFAGTSVVRDDIVFTHHRLQDATMQGQAQHGTAQWAKFTTDEQKQFRRLDMEKLMAAPEWASRFDGWDLERIEHIGVDYINLAAGERAAGAVRLRGRK